MDILLLENVVSSWPTSLHRTLIDISVDVDGVMDGEVVEELTTGVRSLDDLEEYRLM